VFKVFVNYLRNHYRDHKQEFNRQGSDAELSNFENRAEIIPVEESRNIKLRILNEELEKMEDWQRMLLLMRSEGRPYSEIAAYVDKPEEQLKVYYQRLKKNLTDKINEQL